MRTRLRTTLAIDLSQLQRDPLRSASPPPLRRARTAISMLLLSLLLHGGLAAWMIARTGDSTPTDRERIQIELAPPPPPPEPEPEPEAEAEPAPEPAPASPPPRARPAAAPPRPVSSTPPPPAPSASPPRVVGLSLDSTVEGGAGPAFAVGNTLDGRTARIAQEAKEVPPVPGDGTGDAAPAPNRTATRIPTVGVKFTQPRVRNPELKPDYPATLKAQGIEGDVTVLVAIDVAGKVTSVKLLGQPSYPEFAEAVRAFVPRLEYDPATRDGEPVATTITFTIRFRIENE